MLIVIVKTKMPKTKVTQFCSSEDLVCRHNHLTFNHSQYPPKALHANMVPCGRTHETKPDDNWLHKYLWILLQCQTSTYLFVVRRIYIHAQSNLLDLHPMANHILFVVINEFDKNE